MKQVIPTSTKEQCDFTKAKVCKTNCQDDLAWCPKTNEVPNERLEIFLQHVTEIHKMEIQGRKTHNETVIEFLLQYLIGNELRSRVLNIDSKTENSDTINQIIFKPPIRTNFFRITPILFRNSIAMRFEIYSKGILHDFN